MDLVLVGFQLTYMLFIAIAPVFYCMIVAKVLKKPAYWGLSFIPIVNTVTAEVSLNKIPVWSIDYVIFGIAIAMRFLARSMNSLQLAQVSVWLMIGSVIFFVIIGGLATIDLMRKLGMEKKVNIWVYVTFPLLLFEILFIKTKLKNKETKSKDSGLGTL